MSGPFGHGVVVVAAVVSVGCVVVAPDVSVVVVVAPDVSVGCVVVSVGDVEVGA
jgi:hypothetical protein